MNNNEETTEEGISRRQLRSYIAIGVLLFGLGSIPYINSLIPPPDPAPAAETPTTQIVAFDPNTAELPTLRAAGFSRQQAVNLIRYRSSGKIFRIKEELYSLYGMSDSLYYAIEPYINIGEEFRYKQKPKEEAVAVDVKPATTDVRLVAPIKFRIDTVAADYFVAIGALTPRQAATFVKWRDMSGIANIEELRECYTVSDSVALALEPYIIFPEAEAPAAAKLVDINSADSASLCSVRGIGAKSAQAIINYRERLGGYHSPTQLAELREVSESNYEKIILQISCNYCDISKIDINFANPKVLIDHPYIDDRALRRLLKTRELKGGWSTIEQMVEDKIFTTEEAARLRPYLSFRVHQY